MEIIVDTEKHLLYCEDEGRGVAWIELVADEHDEDLIELRSTMVSPMYRGQGMGAKMLEALVESLRQSGRKVTVSCRYANAWFEEHPEAMDVIA